MPTAEAHVETERPSRYLVQLCKHFSNKGRHLGNRPGGRHGGASPALTPAEIRPDQIHVEWSDTHGTLELPWGRCTLEALPGSLVLRAEAEDAQNLRKLQDLLATHIGRFGRREQLTVDWQQDQPAVRQAEHADDPLRMSAQGETARRKHLAWAGVALIAAVAVAVHLGLAGAVLSGSRWAGWVVGAVLAVVAVKVTAVAVLGRRLHRRRRQIG
ncbi:DUF2218 domain-containing protein [Streptomyces sp. NPDC002577]